MSNCGCNSKTGGAKVKKTGRKLRIPETKRKGYVRKDGTKVKSTTVKAHYVPDVGAPGRTQKSQKVLPKPEKGLLKGYKLSSSQAERRKSLSKIAKKKGSLKVARGVQLLANYTKNSVPENAKKYKADADYMYRKYEVEKDKGRRINKKSTKKKVKKSKTKTKK